MRSTRSFLALACAVLVALSGCMGGSAKTNPETGGEPLNGGPGTGAAAGGDTTALELRPKTGGCSVKVSDVDGQVSNAAVGDSSCRIGQVKLDRDVQYDDYGSVSVVITWSNLMPTALKLRAYLRTPACPSDMGACSLASAEGTTSPLKMSLEGDEYKENAKDLFVVLFSDGPTYEQQVKVEFTLNP